MQFCRIFLGLFLVFGLRGNNGTHYAADHKSNLEKKAAKAPVSGKASLVSSSTRLHPALRGQDQETLSTDLNASLQRSWSPTSVESCHGAIAKSSTVEVQGLQEACKSHSGLLSTLRKFLVKLLGQELCASEWSAQQLCWRLSKRRELEMAFDFTKATFSKSEEKKETLSVSERPAPFGRQRIQRQGQQEQSQKDAGKGKDIQESAYKTLDPPLPPQVANPFAASGVLRRDDISFWGPAYFQGWAVSFRVSKALVWSIAPTVKMSCGLITGAPPAQQ